MVSFQGASAEATAGKEYSLHPQVGVKGIPIDWHLLIVSETQGDRTIASV